MNKYVKIAILAILPLMALGIAIGCSDKAFVASNSATTSCDDDTDLACTKSCDFGACFKDYDYEKDSTAGIADVLFVVDNSGSMSPEQREMGQRFPKLLEKVNQLDYRIGITTTDISNSGNPPLPKNGNGAWQDGKLIDFENQRPFLDGTLTQSREEELFLNTIERSETHVCEDNNFELDKCPSGDERGLMAAYLTLLNNYNGFLRSTGHLAVVILSDEDERSKGSGQTSRPFEPQEYPQNFLAEFKRLYPQKSMEGSLDSDSTR